MKHYIRIKIPNPFNQNPESQIQTHNNTKQLIPTSEFQSPNLRPTIPGVENRKQKRFSPLRCWNPHKSLASLVLFQSLPRQRKKSAFRTQHLTADTNSRLTDHGSWLKLEGVFSTERRVLAANFEGRKRSVSRDHAWDVGAWPICVSTFAIQNRRSFPIGKKRYINGSVSPVPRETSRRRPSMALKLGREDLRSVDHTPSKFGHDPFPVRRGLVAAVKCCMRKSRFFAVRTCFGTEIRSYNLVWVSTPKGENLFSFLFSDSLACPNIIVIIHSKSKSN